MAKRVKERTAGAANGRKGVHRADVAEEGRRTGDEGSGASRVDAIADEGANAAPEGSAGEWEDEKEGFDVPKPRQSASFMQTMMIFLFMMTLLVIFDPEMRRGAGLAVGALLEPLIGFDARYPVLTLLCASVLMVGFSSVLRHFTTDWYEQARTQKILSAYNKELREARMSGNQSRIKKLMESQGEIMQYQSRMMMMSMKAMVFTTIVAISIFTWLFTFFDSMEFRYISLPWSPRWSMMDTAYVFPNWILVYSLVSIPIGQLIIRLLKVIEFMPRGRSA